MTPLRIAILANFNATFAAWEARLFERIAADPSLSLVAVLTANEPAQGAPKGLAAALARLDQRALAGPSENFAYGQASALSAVPVVALKTSQGTSSLVSRDKAVLEDAKLDVILIHGCDWLSPALSAHVKFGCWMLSSQGARLDLRDASVIGRFVQQGPLVSVCLQALVAGSPSPTTLAAAKFNQERSPAVTAVRTGEKSVSLIIKTLREMSIAQKLPRCSTPVQPKAPNASALAYGKLLSKEVSKKITKRAATSAGKLPMRWSLFVGHGPFEPSKLSQARERAAAPGEFWADPFLFEKDGKTYVFFENYVYATGRGKISVAVLDNERFDIIGDALDLPYHLSFPFVFEHNGSNYMLPETSEVRRLEIWRAVDFPLKWERHATALEGTSIADPVLFQDQGTWWLFANVSKTPFEDHCNELHIWKVDGPDLRSLTPHALNPVVIGADTARNAGRIVRRNGQLQRISQNNSNGVYGYGFNVMAIEDLSLERYSERLVAEAKPDFNAELIGTHHMDQTAKAFIIDGCRRYG